MLSDLAYRGRLPLLLQKVQELKQQNPALVPWLDQLHASASKYDNKAVRDLLQQAQAILCTAKRWQARAEEAQSVESARMTTAATNETASMLGELRNNPVVSGLFVVVREGEQRGFAPQRTHEN